MTSNIRLFTSYLFIVNILEFIAFLLGFSFLSFLINVLKFLLIIIVMSCTPDTDFSETRKNYKLIVFNFFSV